MHTVFRQLTCSRGTGDTEERLMGFQELKEEQKLISSKFFFKTITSQLSLVALVVMDSLVTQKEQPIISDTLVASGICIGHPKLQNKK